MSEDKANPESSGIVAATDLKPKRVLPKKPMVLALAAFLLVVLLIAGGMWLHRSQVTRKKAVITPAQAQQDVLDANSMTSTNDFSGQERNLKSLAQSDPQLKNDIFYNQQLFIACSNNGDKQCMRDTAHTLKALGKGTDSYLAGLPDVVIAQIKEYTQ